ncbi:hypothetical protein ACO02O_03099 [Dirofilaria immitis]
MSGVIMIRKVALIIATNDYVEDRQNFVSKFLPNKDSFRLVMYFIQSTSMIYMDSVVISGTIVVTTRKFLVSRNKFFEVHVD